MHELKPGDILLDDEYEASRAGEQRHLADVKRHRRIVLDDAIELVFENLETVRGVVEEMVRTEHLHDHGEIAAEVGAFNAIVPRLGELSACLYLEVNDAADLARRAEQLVGVERTVWLLIGDERVDVLVEEVEVEPETPAMYHLRFRPTTEQRRAWQEGARIVMGCDHPACTSRVELTQDQSQALVADLEV